MDEVLASSDLEPAMPCAVVLTALGLEFKAVRAHLTDARDEHDRQGTIYTCGVFDTPRGRWRVAIAECGAHNARAQAVAHLAISHFDPAVVMFVGVAGSLKTDVPLGDVVASTKVYNYHSGKAEADFLPRPVVENTSYALEQLARSVARNAAWLFRTTSRHPDRPSDPAAHVGPIAAGEQVDADQRSHTHQLIKRFYSDALVVEMEGYGTLTAANISRVPAIVVRAVSDNVVDKADCDGKGWQPVAAGNAAAFAFELLAHFRADGFPGAPRVGRTTSGAGSPGVQPDAATAADGALAELHRAVGAASAPLLAWPTDLGRGEWLARPELGVLRDRIRDSEHSTTLLLGGPGAGKSALLARLGQSLVEQGVAVLAIKADLLTDDVHDGPTLGAHLGLSGPAADCVRRLAVTGTVVVLVDQLDALAGLVDLRPGRLNALLNLTRSLHKVAGVHVVCSCREFERRRDARLTAIDAEAVELALPSWEQVGEVLTARGVNPAGWPESFRELLRPPQHLKVFLQGITAPSEARVYGTYQLMLDDFWSKRVTDPHGPPGRPELLMDLATMMADDETLWVPQARFEERQALVDALVGGGVLVRATTGAGLGFSHQTLFEHAWARAFARQRCSLADYAVARQGGLFVRSAVWAGLNYLRGADPAGYRREFGRLWDRTDLRGHLRHLLVEFLGTDPEPGPREEGWLFAAMNEPGLEARALAAARGNPAWFDRLARAHLPRLMRSAGPQSGPLLGVLASAWAFARETCLRLVREVWMPDPTKDDLAVRVLSTLPAWDEPAVDMVCRVVGRTAISRSYVMHLASQVTETAPHLAPRVIGAALARELDAMEREPDPEPEPLPDDATDAQRAVHAVTHRPKERFRRFIDSGTDWYGLDAVAERSPAAFLREVWPRFLRALTPLLGEAGAYPGRYRRDGCLGLELSGEEGGGRTSQFPDAIDLAVQTLAAELPGEFAVFLETEQGRDCRTTQRMLARGLAAGLPGTRELAVRFLLADVRRFSLGSFQDEYRDSVALVVALRPHLRLPEVRSLERAILSWHPLFEQPGAAPRWRFEVRRINRRERLRLLTALPPEQLSPSVRTLIGQETARFPDHESAGVHRIRGGIIQSRMSADQMQRAADADIERLFQKLPDTTGGSHPRDMMLGGSVQASQEFERFAAACPGRAIAILSSFQPGRNDRPAGYALTGIAESDYADADLFDLILSLDGRGFGEEEFRVSAARAAGKRCRDNAGLPSRVCELLERWLPGPWRPTGVSYSGPPGRAEDRGRSVLWHGGGIVISPQGVYTLLHTLTYGYLLRKRHDADRWLTLLESQIDAVDDVDTWRALSREFKYLWMCNHASAARFLRRLFERQPGVVACETGAAVLARAWQVAPSEDVWGWYSLLRRSGWDRGAQAYGELVAVRAAQAGDARAAAEVQRHTAPADADADTPDVRLGIALACAHLWSEPASRTFATDTMLRIIPAATGRLAQAILDVFAFANDSPPDGETSRLLAALAEHPQVLGGLGEGYIIEHIEALLPHEAELVYRLCREVVRVRGSDLGSLASRWSLHAANLTSISLTLQRLGPGSRESGLELFESLLEAGFPDAESTLREIDNRLPSPAQGAAPRPRRRRKSRAARSVSP